MVRQAGSTTTRGCYSTPDPRTTSECDARAPGRFLTCIVFDSFQVFEHLLHVPIHVCPSKGGAGLSVRLNWGYGSGR